MCVFLLFLCSVVGKEQTRKEFSRVEKFNQGCLLFFEEGRRKNIFLNLSWIHKSLLRA